MRSRSIALAATTLTVAWCSTARADDAADKKALEQKLAEMQKQIDEMSKKMSDGSNRSEDELEQRVAELEKITKKDQDGLFAYWKNGLKLDSADGAFKLSIFGRAQVDFTAWDNSKGDNANAKALGPSNFSTEWRRVRLGAAGTIYKNVEYKVEVDFADQGNGTAAFSDVYMQLDNVAGHPVNVRVGHFDEPFGLDRVTSSKYTTFTERSLVEQVFAPGRNTGAMVFGQAAENHVAWFLGAFRDTDPYGNRVAPARPGENDVTARVTGRPWISEDGRDWVHLGLSGTRRNPNGETAQFRARPEVHVGPRFVDTGVLANVDQIYQYGLEAAANFGSFHAQAEYAQADTSGASGPRLPKKTFGTEAVNHSFNAESIQVGYFLTGENREYDAPMARWNRIKVKKNYGDGPGAVEVALRWSHVDLNDNGDLDRGDITKTKFVDAGTMTDVTFGINWYLNPNTKVMFDVVHFNPSRTVRTGSGATLKGFDLKEGNAFVMSFRIDF